MCPSIRMEDGEFCESTDEQVMRWHRHFSGVLQNVSSFEYDIPDDVPQQPVSAWLGEAPTIVELRQAIRHLSMKRAAGESRILPEIVRHAGPVFEAALPYLLHRVRGEENVPRDWVNAIIIPIPKKGILEVCDNWRGIALLNVVGKVLARLVQNSLHEVAEQILPEFQCGFRQSRGCTDMIFVVRQCIEKLYEHREKGFLIFIDLKKAYESVPRAALWLLLAKAGLPDGLITIIHSFHDGMEAVVATAGGTTQPIYVDNGLRQGCSLAPLLFDVFMWAAFSCLLKAIQSTDGVGLAYRYELDGKLMFQRRRSDSLFHLTDCHFANDSVLMASSRQAAQLTLGAFSSIASSFGLTINVAKTKFLVLPRYKDTNQNTKTTWIPHKTTYMYNDTTEY